MTDIGLTSEAGGSHLRGGGAILDGRIRFDDLLKTGHGVDTFAATDLLGGNPVVVKRVAATGLDDSMRIRLEHEAEVLRRLSGLCVGSAVSLVHEGDFVYLVKPYVPGVALEQRLAGGPLSLGSTLRIGIDLFNALQQAHENGVLHRDVKPANVITDTGEPLARAVLIDFGFARSASLDASLRDERVGTARYLAPEAAGLFGSAVDARSDLYSAGVLLFECLAGRPPFEASDVGGVLREHLSRPAPPLRSLGVEVPRALDALVQRLLRKDPAERYQSAAAVAGDLDAIAAAVERGEPEPIVVIGANDRRQALTEPSFVGRTAELVRLEKHIERAAGGRGGLVLVEADSGGGKTRLLDELDHQVQRQAWILRGQAVHQAAQRPFQLLEGVVAGVLAACQDNPETTAAIGGRLGDRREAVVAALPELARAIGDADAESLGPEAYGETRSISALCVLLDALGAGQRSAVVILDDCQWADGPTLRLLREWQERVRHTRTNVLVIAAYRSEEVSQSHILRSMTPAATIVLAPFAASDVRALAESMAGPLPADAIDTVASLSEGSPFMAAAVLRGLVEVGALIDSGSGWATDAQQLAHVQTSRRAALFLVRRLELLSPATLEFLSSGAVLGKEFEIEVAAELSGHDAATAESALREASRRCIVWTSEDGGRRASFFHDKLREALLGRLSAEERRAKHFRAALLFEASDPDRIFELAYHFDAAGRDDKALPYALRAAELARMQYSLDVAAAHYRMVMRALPKGNVKARGRVAEGLGDVLTLQGAYEEATAALEEARTAATTDFERATIAGKLGDVAFKCGDQGLAAAHLESALRQLRQRLPARGMGFVMALVVEVVVQVFHTLLPRLFVGRRSLPAQSADGDTSEKSAIDSEFLAIRLYSRLAYVYWFSRGKVPCTWAHLRELNLVERYEPTRELAQAYSEHAPAMTMIPWFSRGIQYAERSLAIRRNLGDVWGQGQSLHFYGVVLHAASRYRECIEKCEEAVRLLDRTGDRWEANTADWHISFSQYRLGQLGPAAAGAKRVHEAAAAIKDDASAGITLDVWARSSGGDVPAELIHEQLTRPNADVQTIVDVRIADAMRLMSEGSLAGALETLEVADELVRRAGLRQEYVAAVLPWMATVLRLQAEATPAYEVETRARLVRKARRVARRAWRAARYYRNNAPHTLRERGLIAALDGRGRRARTLLEQSIAEADRQGALHERALSRQAWGRVGSALGWAGAKAVLDGADAELAALIPHAGDEAATDEVLTSQNLSLADRFSTLLEMGRTIASGPSRTAVYAAIRESATTLLRGDHCRVLDVRDVGHPSETASGQQIDRLSQSLISTALDSGAPVVLSDTNLSDSADSVVLSELRSALCAPIYCDGEPVAFLYVTHGQVSGLFGPDEIRLTEFITTLGGAALEHVAGTEARFRSLAQNSTDVITIVDRDAAIRYQSAAVMPVFGFDPSDLIGSRLADWIHPEDLPAALEVLESAVATDGPPRLLECRLRHHEGSWRDVETALSNLLDDPSVNGLVLNSRDISDRKRAERELLETLEREHEMRERLQELDRIKTDFVSSVSHELRTPLSSILGYVEMLTDGTSVVLDPTTGRVLNVVDRNARRLLVLIEDLLTISRVESGTFRLSLGPVNISMLIDSAYQAVLPDISGRPLDMEIDVGDDIGVITGDAIQLDRVIINLLTNAIKFTPDGGRIELAARRTSDDVVIRVSDTGIGIPLEDQPRLFERFFRSSSAQELAVPGTGLGLSITKNVIEQHGGDISVRSVPGEGTEVTVCLPAEPPVAITTGPASAGMAGAGMAGAA